MVAPIDNFSARSSATITKLPTSYVFDKMRPLICSINSPWGESSGFLIDSEGTVLTVAHNIIPFEKDSDGDLVQVLYDGTPYFPTLSTKIVQETARIVDLYYLKTKINSSALETISMLPDHIKLKEGMKVYFAGYPLGQDTVTFHKGTISSITIDQEILQFTIDGTVVPGNSGGPVVIQQEGTLYIAGVITSEVADFTPEDQKTIAIMRALKEQQKSDLASGDASIQIGDSVMSAGGLTTTVQIQTPQGSEKVKVNDRDTIFLALDLIQRNLSTGIGNAIDIRHFRLLSQTMSKSATMSRHSFPVAKGKKLIQGTIGLEEKEQKLTKYMEVRYGRSGPGNRGIRITLCPSLGTGSLVYKFTPNPHDRRGYNKNQRELYNKAALEFTRLFLETKQDPQSFPFTAYKSEYTATLETV